MASQAQVQMAENIIGYRFASDFYLRQALTAAGAETNNHDGNRALALIGAHWIDTLLMIVLMGIDANKGEYLRISCDGRCDNHF